MKEEMKKKRGNILPCNRHSDINVYVAGWKTPKTERKLQSTLRISLSGSGMQPFFCPEWKEESLIRMCWEIIVSLRAIGPFHVYIMHMHGLEQSSETRYPIPHSAAQKVSLCNTFFGPETQSWKVKTEGWNKHVVDIWALTCAICRK